MLSSVLTNWNNSDVRYLSSFVKKLKINVIQKHQRKMYLTLIPPIIYQCQPTWILNTGVSYKNHCNISFITLLRKIILIGMVCNLGVWRSTEIRKVWTKVKTKHKSFQKCLKNVDQISNFLLFFCPLWKPQNWMCPFSFWGLYNVRLINIYFSLLAFTMDRPIT